ncbi:hypothetical protein [Gryllotalpicola protaetiae]|uniref:Uncharacterized protein n=1 Tax=Gryllotalpicola protaetiae TaxID=2419771 RepID=A0A387BM14_9MICO|nr:hypothetical protein [Gryllotalpicola protaetiae]AYG03422.1 hypothetical protein D7I44_07655 [Gryllotalpicola protaetiae]
MTHSALILADNGSTTGNIDLVTPWNTLWSSVQDTVGPQILNLMTIVGVILVVFAIGKWIFDKRRGGGAHKGLDTLLWAFLAGCVLAAPGLLIPAVVNFLDYGANAILHLISHANTGSNSYTGTSGS